MMCNILYLYKQGTGYRNISIFRLFAHTVKLAPSSFLPIFGIVLFSWVLFTGCGRFLLGRPSLSPRLLGGGGGGPPDPSPGFPGFPGSPGFSEFGLLGRDGVLGGAGAFPLLPVSVSTGRVVVPLIFGAGPSPGVRRKWSIFRGFGLGVSPFLGVFPVGYLPGKRSALGVYGGGRPLINSP